MCSSEILQMGECADKNTILPEAAFLRISFLKEKKKKAILKSCIPFSSEIRAHKVLIYDTGHVMPLPLDLLSVHPHMNMRLAHFLILQPSGYSIKITPKPCYNSVILCPPRTQRSDEPHPYSDSNTCKCSSAVHAEQEVSLLYQAFDKWEDGTGMISAPVLLLLILFFMLLANYAEAVCSLSHFRRKMTLIWD